VFSDQRQHFHATVVTARYWVGTSWWQSEQGYSKRGKRFGRP